MSRAAHERHRAAPDAARPGSVLSGTLAQYVGRLHRLHPGKGEVVVYDYIDQAVPVLKRMSEADEGIQELWLLDRWPNYSLMHFLGSLIVSRADGIFPPLCGKCFVAAEAENLPIVVDSG